MRTGFLRLAPARELLERGLVPVRDALRRHGGRVLRLLAQLLVVLLLDRQQRQPCA